ncbi:MAG: hypothetical protein J0L95_02315 [Candidatus Accumulibacter sp.]|uniref:FAD-linked oxidase C-terminal domain-containing protein n=1 Tax=Accumulibacter sp. TaxID=2053492 RepID=UPI001AD065BB|nr:FAD-linked oxidase C-terminal domain-containing protein [Accumulibacter sp.]MBN8436872.1 hypothetical protein [Accumulibacter sp.]
MNTHRTLLLPDDFVVTLKSHFAQGELVCAQYGRVASAHRPAPTAGVCVLISRLAECIHLTNQDIAQVSVPIARFDHVGNGTLTVMRAIKAALDPDNSLNPSKILPLA